MIVSLWNSISIAASTHKIYALSEYFFLVLYSIKRPNLTATIEGKSYWFHKMSSVCKLDYLNTYVRQHKLGKQSGKIVLTAESNIRQMCQPLTGLTHSAALLQSFYFCNLSIMFYVVLAFVCCFPVLLYYKRVFMCVKRVL